MSFRTVLKTVLHGQEIIFLGSFYSDHSLDPFCEKEYCPIESQWIVEEKTENE